MKKADILNILRSKASVFTFKDILLATDEAKPLLLARRLNYYIKKGELYHIRRGLYAKDKNYDRLELATKIFTPSYVSFETILREAGVIFQYYSTIFVASYQTKEIVCDGQTYSFKKIKDTILTNNAGIERRNSYAVASKERAFLDILYLNKDYHFDNLAPLNFDKIFALLPMYNNQRMTKKVNLYFEEFKANKVEINLRDFGSQYEVKSYLGISMKVMKKEDMAAHKMVAMTERIGQANRDIFDTYFFLNNNWPINEQIIERRTGLPIRQFLKKCIDELEAMSNVGILSGLGELLDAKQKIWVKNKLLTETIFLLKLKLESYPPQKT